MATPVQMPKQGNSVEECLIVGWNIKEGDKVNTGDILCTIETDKATFEVEAPATGQILKLLYEPDSLVPVLTNIAIIGEAGEDISNLEIAAPETTTAKEPEPLAAKETATSAAATQPSPAARPTQPEREGGLRISPRARRDALQKGIDPNLIQGSGPMGRIVSADVLAHSNRYGHLTPLAKSTAQNTGLVAGAGSGIGGRVRGQDLVNAKSIKAETENIPPQEIPYRGIRKLIGERMLQSLQEHAQLTLNATADAGAIMQLRKKIKGADADLGLPKLTINDMIAAAVAWTLPQFPEVNAIFNYREEKILQYRQVHLAIAVDTDRGLMVPVIQNSQNMSLSQISAAISALAKDCRSGSINPDLLQGGTFTISNLGMLGVESFTPILNSPQVAILGVCTIKNTAASDGKGGCIFKPQLGLSLTIDHQVVDGATGARFLQALGQCISEFDFNLCLQAF